MCARAAPLQAAASLLGRGGGLSLGGIAHHLMWLLGCLGAWLQGLLHTDGAQEGNRRAARHHLLHGTQPRSLRHAGCGQLQRRRGAAGRPHPGTAVPAGGGAHRRADTCEPACSPSAASAYSLDPASLSASQAATRALHPNRPLPCHCHCSALPCPALPCPALPCPPPAVYPHLCWRPSVPNLLQLQLCFSADGNFLYTGARKDAAIRCWDVRYSSGGGRAVDGLCGCVGCCGCWDACYSSGALLAAAAVRCSQQQPDLRPLRQYTSAPPSPAASLSLVALFSSSCSVFLQAWCTALRGRAGAPTSACTST